METGTAGMANAPGKSSSPGGGAGKRTDGAPLGLGPDVAGAVTQTLHRFRRGFVQGCPMSTFFAVLLAHMALHTVHKNNPGLGSVSIADDSYFTAPPG